MRQGKTLAAEREKPLQESERMQERKKQRTRKGLRLLLALAFFAVLAWLMITGVRGLIDLLAKKDDDGGSTNNHYTLMAEIVDEAGAGVTSGVKTFIEQMERDLAEYGYELERAVLPAQKMRQLDLYIEGKNGYIKVRSDRGAGEQAEDIDRMLRYLGEQDFEYLDVRLEGKAYWK